MADDQIRRTVAVESGGAESGLGRGATLIPGHGDSFGAANAYISWRSIFAGFLVAILCFAILMTLGMGIGGFALGQVVQGPSSGGGWSIGAAIWSVVAIIISLFAGGYFAGRFSSFITPRIGGAQGLVIASLFTILFFWQAFSAIGWVGRTATSAVGVAADQVTNVASQPPVQDALNQVMANLNIENPQAVAQGVLQRVMTGNYDGAVNYLAIQAKIPPEQARQRLDQVRANLQNALEQTAITTANVISGAGWSLFVMTVLGAIAGSLGGGLGARENRRHPIEAEAREVVRQPTPAGV